MFYQTPNLTVFERNDIFEICFAFTDLAQIFILIWSGSKIIKSYPKSIKIERYDSTDSTGTTKSKNDKNNPYEKPPYSYMAMIQVNIWPIWPHLTTSANPTQNVQPRHFFAWFLLSGRCSLMMPTGEIFFAWWIIGFLFNSILR